MSLILSGSDGVSDIDGSASTPAIRGTDANTGIFFPAADTIAFGEGGAEAMRIDSSANVGIGTSTIRGRLTVSDGAVNTAGEAVYQAYIAGTSRTFTSDGTGMLTIQSTNDLAVNVGGSIAFGGRAVSASTAGANWAAISGFKENATTSEFGGYIQFATRPNSGSITERARITSAGYFKASNSATYGNPTGAYHELNNDANSQSLIIAGSSTSLTADGILRIDSSRNTTNNTYYALTYYHGGTGTYKFRIADSGNATNTNGSYGTISDAKLKQDIVDATPQWDDIKNLRFRKYRLKSEVELDPSAKPLLGLVAQEAELVCPGLVEEHTDRDSDDNDLGTTTKSIKTSILYMKAVKALQEAMERIETLEAQNAAFETRLAALENK